MSTINFKSTFARTIALIVLFVAFISTSAFAGRDSFEISLNNKVIKKQYVGENTGGLLDLQLDKSNMNDQLVITYFHCMVKGTAKGRNIVIKNAKNEVVKEWKFADVAGDDGAMRIPVKDILALQKNYPESTLNLYYFSTAELPNGMMLAAVKPAGKAVSFILPANARQYAKL